MAESIGRRLDSDWNAVAAVAWISDYFSLLNRAIKAR